MADESVGSVSIDLVANSSGFMNQVSAIATQAGDVIGNSVGRAFAGGPVNADMSGITSVLNGMSGKLDNVIANGVARGAEKGAEQAKAVVTEAISTVKMPAVKVALNKEDLGKQLENMLSQLDNTNAKIYVQQQAVDELKRKWRALANMGTQDAGEGLALQQKILNAESALLKLENESDTMVAKTNAVEAAINGLGTNAKQDVEKIATAAVATEKKVESIGTAAQKTEKKTKISMAGIVKSISGAGKSNGLGSMLGGGSGLEKRLSSIERNVQKTTRSVTALGRRFFVLFTGKLISEAFKGTAESLDAAAKKSDTLKNSMNLLTSAGKNTSNGVIAAISPLINIVAPVLGNIANKIRVFSNQVAMFIAGIAGQKTVLQAKEAYDEYGDSATGAAKAAEAAQKTLAGFDTLNILSDKSSTSGGSGSSSGASGADYEEVAVVGNEATKKIKDALDRLAPALSNFYEKCLKPFGNWVISEGLPDFLDFLTNTANFFADNPQLVDNVAGFVAAMLGLSTLGVLNPTTAAVAVTIFATVSAIEWASGRDLGKAVSDSFNTELWKSAGDGSLAQGVWDYYLYNLRYGVITPTTFAEGSILDQFVESMMKNLNIDTTQYYPALYEIGMNLGINMVNGLIGVLNGAFDKIEDALNPMLEKLGAEPISVHIDPIDTVQFYKDLDGAAEKTKISADLMYESFQNMPVQVKKPMNQVSGYVREATRDQSRTIQDYESKVKSGVTTTSTTVKLQTTEAARVMSYQARVGVQAAQGSYQGMPSAVRGYLDSLTGNVQAATGNAGSALTGGTSKATGSTSEYYRNMINKVADYLTGLMSYSQRAVTNSFETFQGMPTSVQKYLGLTWSGYKASQVISLPHFGNGGVISQPTVAMIGERGKEAVMPLENNTGWIDQLASKVADKSGDGGGDIYLTVPVYFAGKLVDVIEKKISRKDRQLNRATT